MAGRAQKTGLVFGAIVLALLSSEAMADSAVLAHGEHAHVSGDVQARAIAPRVAGLIDESVPRIARLVGTDNLTLLPVAQIFIIVFAAILAGFILWRISVHARTNEEHIAWGGWFLVLDGCAVYVGISLAIVLRA